MDFRLLGPLEVDDDQGGAVELGGRQQKLVLAMLLLHRNEVVSVDRLIEALWVARPPSNAVKNVQVHISRLRRAFEVASQEGSLRTQAGGYALGVAPGELDLDRFERLLEDGRRALAGGDPEGAEAALRETLELWRGPPLADFAYDSFAQGEIARLEELRLAAVEERIETDLQLGRHVEVAAELHRLVAEHPLRERPRAQLMLALHRAGRKADALRVYEEGRRLLAEELGLEPGETTRRLQSALLADDPALAAPPRVPPRPPAGDAADQPPLLAGRSRVLLGAGGALLLAAALAVAALALSRDQTSAGIVAVGPNSLAAIDPDTNELVAAIPVGTKPASVVSAHGSFWVANLDDETVSRVDADAGRVVRTVPTGTAPAALAAGHGAIWAIGDDGIVLRIDPAFVVGDRVWVTSQEAVQEFRSDPGPTGETLRLTSSASFQTDPALAPDRQINYATCAKLLTYSDAPAPEGTRLVPEVAAALPTRSLDGRTYTFTIRKGFAFSPPLREPVTAQTFKHAIERSLHTKMGPGAAALAPNIAGLDAYRAGKATAISGIVVDGNRLSITLVGPDPTFLARIALPSFCAVPVNAPIAPRGVPAIASAGPYYITEEVPDRVIVLERNPNYRGSRPRRFREIRFTLGVAATKGVADVLAGRSDYLADNPPVKSDPELLARYGPTSRPAANGGQQYHINPTLSLAFLELNTRRPLFSDVRLRKAVNYAIDRRALAQIGNWVTGPFASIPTDQYLPPTMPGASPTVLYPPTGDLQAARQLAPNAHGTAVLYTCDDYPPLCRRPAEQIRTNLGALGLQVDIREFPFEELFERISRQRDNFLNFLLAGNVRPKYVRKLERVARLTGAARYRAYRSLSVELARDEAPWVAYAAGGSRDLFAARIGCQVFHPVYGTDLGALCLRS